MRYFWLVFVVIFLVSCNKEKRIARDLVGDWQIEIIKLQDADGFTFLDNEPQGKIHISDGKVQGEVWANFQTFQGAFFDTLSLNASLELKLAESELNWIQSMDTLKNRIFVITRSDLEIEHYDAANQIRLHYVFKKVK